MKYLSLWSLLLTGQTVLAASSTLDWYSPKADSGAFYCVDKNTHDYIGCDEWGTRTANEFANRIMDQCKTASCSGSFSDYGLDVDVSAVFIPEAKDEFRTQVHNIMQKMKDIKGDQIGSGPPTLAHIRYPTQMILNRHGGDAEQGHMTITIHKDDGDACAVMKKIGAAGSVIPEVGPFFGLIGIADC